MKKKTSVCKLPTQHEIDDMIEEIVEELDYDLYKDIYLHLESEESQTILHNIKEIVRRYIKPVQLTKVTHVSSKKHNSI